MIVSNLGKSKNGIAYASIIVNGLEAIDTITCTSPSGKSKTAAWNSDGYWLISELDEFGTYIISASRDTKSTSANVLIDLATEYSIELNYCLYLIKDYEIQDGYTWVGVINSSSGTTSYYGGGERVPSTSYRTRSVSIGDTVALSLIKSSTISDGCSGQSTAYCNTLIDMSKYKTINAIAHYTDVLTSSDTHNSNVSLMIGSACSASTLTSSATASDVYTVCSLATYSAQTFEGDCQLSIDISEITTNLYIILNSFAWGNAVSNYTVTWDSVWLE